MTTFELAGILEELARILRKLPDAKLDSTAISSMTATASRSPKRSTSGVNGISLARISKYTKSELIKLIVENGVPISVRSKDSAESVLRKLRTYLQDNDFSKRRIRNQVAHGKTSPELTSALAYLLKDRYE